MTPVHAEMPLLVLVISFVFLVVPADGLFCAQCNMRLRGVSNTCISPRNMTDCIGCMKTTTKVLLRDSGYMDGWTRLSEVTSRFCIRAGSLGIKPAGCYKQQNNGGYTERCYCYTDNCNSGAERPGLQRLSWSLTLSVASILFTSALMARLTHA